MVDAGDKGRLSIVVRVYVLQEILMQEYKAVIKQQGEWWYGWVEEMPGVNCQERSEEELMETLGVTLRETIELNRE